MEHRSPGGGDMTRSMRLLAAVPLTVLFLALASPAFADEPCDPLNVTCVVTSAAEFGQGTVADTIDTATGTAKPIVDDPVGTVGRILNPGSVEPPGGGGGGGGGGSGGQPNGGHTGDRPPAAGRPTPHGSQVGRPAGSPTSRPPIAVPSNEPPAFPDPLSGALGFGGPGPCAVCGLA